MYGIRCIGLESYLYFYNNIHLRNNTRNALDDADDEYITDDEDEDDCFDMGWRSSCLFAAFQGGHVGVVRTTILVEVIVKEGSTQDHQGQIMSDLQFSA